VSAILRASITNLTQAVPSPARVRSRSSWPKRWFLKLSFSSQRNAERKIVEIIVASEIKRKYTKNEILQIYLNEIFYGNFAYGIEAASQTYFNNSD